MPEHKSDPVDSPRRSEHVLLSQRLRLPRPNVVPSGVVWLGLLGLMLLSGCSERSDRSSDVDLSVGFPAGGSDPGSLTNSGIEPPKLGSLDEKSQGVRLVQQGGKPELVPTPRPKIDAEEVPRPEGDPDGKKPAVLKPEDYKDWKRPDLTLVVTGQQHGYIEPCGCTGLTNQKGGVARRYTFIDQLRKRGWDLFPVDAGNQVRRIGRQAQIKLSWSSDALKQMKYEAVGFGPDDLRLSAIDLVQVAAADSPESAMYVSANVEIIDPSFMPTHKIVERGDIKIGVTTVLDPEALGGPAGPDFTIKPPKEAAEEALKKMKEGGATFNVLAFFGTEKEAEESAKKLVQEVPGFDLVIAGGGYGEPTYQTEKIEGSKTELIVPGNKGMYVGLVGIYKDGPPKYARVPLTHEFKDAPEMRKLMAEYQDQLKAMGLDGLGLKPVRHSSEDQFVGSVTCGKCHPTAYAIWEGTPHFDATESIVQPKEDRGDVPRHFDPECISCHVTGWNPQRYYPYESGYLSLDADVHLHGSGCENCHGPGAGHAKAEQEGSGVSDEERARLREAVTLPLERAREKCMECHDLDNSPDFHVDDAFEDSYWPEVEHYGTD